MLINKLSDARLNLRTSLDAVCVLVDGLALWIVVSRLIRLALRAASRPGMGKRIVLRFLSPPSSLAT